MMYVFIKTVLIIIITFIVDYILYRFFQYKEKNADYYDICQKTISAEKASMEYARSLAAKSGKNYRFIKGALPVVTAGGGIGLLKEDGYILNKTL